MNEERMNGPRRAGSFADYLDDAATVLPDALDVNRVAEQMVDAFQSTGGATFNLHFGNMIGNPCFAVSVYQDPEAIHSKWWKGKSLSVFKFEAFITSNRELLREPRNSVGVWYDTDSKRTYLEVTATLPFRDKSDYTKAIHQGKQYNQIGIYDLEEEVYLSLGGTGALPENTPPISDRLPTLQRGGEL